MFKSAIILTFRGSEGLPAASTQMLCLLQLLGVLQDAVGGSIEKPHLALYAIVKFEIMQGPGECTAYVLEAKLPNDSSLCLLDGLIGYFKCHNAHCIAFFGGFGFTLSQIVGT